MSRSVAIDSLYDMIWREADRLEDQTNEAQVPSIVRRETGCRRTVFSVMASPPSFFWFEPV
jgi:hypothetical protein